MVPYKARDPLFSIGDDSDTDEGWYAEICVPRSAINIVSGKVCLNFLLHDEGHDDESLSASLDPSYWVEVSGL